MKKYWKLWCLRRLICILENRRYISISRRMMRSHLIKGILFFRVRCWDISRSCLLGFWSIHQDIYRVETKWCLLLVCNYYPNLCFIESCRWYFSAAEVRHPGNVYSMGEKSMGWGLMIRNDLSRIYPNILFHQSILSNFL